MKITVGHLLIVAGVATYAVVGPLGKTLQPQINAARTFAADKLPYMEFLRPESPSAVESPLVPVKAVPPPSVPAVPGASAPAAMDLSANVADKLPPEETAGTAPAVSNVPPAPEASATESSPVSEPPKERPAPRRRRRHRVVKPAAATSSEAEAKPAAAKHTGKKDPLVGTYVALTLNTGNVVKGVLVERTATNYKVELPGMGPFDYPASTVKNIGPAE